MNDRWLWMCGGDVVMEYHECLGGNIFRDVVRKKVCSLRRSWFIDDDVGEFEVLIEKERGCVLFCVETIKGVMAFSVVISISRILRDTPPITSLWYSSFTEITLSTQRSPIIPRRRVMILSPRHPIPNGPIHMMTVRKRVGPFLVPQLAVGHLVDHSSSDYFSPDDSARDSSSDSSSETSSDFHSDASYDSSSGHSLSPTMSVPVLSHVSKALSPVRADLIPSPKRIKDSGYLADVERLVEIDECIAYAEDALRDRGLLLRVVVEDCWIEMRQRRGAVEVMYETLGDLVQMRTDHNFRLSQSIRGITGGLEAPKMPNTRSGASVTYEEVEELVTRRVAEEMEAREAARTLEPLNENGDEQEGENGGNGNGGNRGNENGGNGGNGNGGNGENRNGNRNGNHGMNYGGFMPVARECTFQDFLKCKPHNFSGTEGVVGLTRWFKKMESVFNISNCPPKYQVKYATCTLHVTPSKSGRSGKVVQNAVQNPGVQNVENQNGLIVVPGIAPPIANHNANQNGNGNVVAARAETLLLIAQKEEAGIQLQAKEFNLMAAARNIDEIEDVNANYGTSEVPDSYNCYDNEIFNMFTQEEQYTELLEPISEPHQIHQNNSNVILDASSVEQSRGTIDQNPATTEEIRAHFESLYNNLATEVERVNMVNRKMWETNADLTTELARYKTKPDSFYHTELKMALGYPNPHYLKQAQQKQQSLYNGRVLLENHDPPVVYDSEETLQLSQESHLKMKQLNKKIKPANYEKINKLYEVFVSQKAKSREQVYFSNTAKMANVSKSFSIPDEESSDNTPSVAQKFLNEVKDTLVTLQRVVKHRMNGNITNLSSSTHQEIHKIFKDEIVPIVNQVDARVQNFENHFVKEATKFVRDFKSLAKEDDDSLDKIKVLEIENERLLRAVVSQDIVSIVQNNFVVDTSDLHTELDPYNDMQNQIERMQAQLGDLKGKSSNTQCASNTLDHLSHKLEDENVSLEFQNTTKGTSVNTQFSKQSILGKSPSYSQPKLYSVTPFPKSMVSLKGDETNALLKPVTSNSAPSTRESIVVKNDKVIAPRMFRINPFKTSGKEKPVPNKPLRTSVRTKPITVSQPSIIHKKYVNSNSNGSSSTGVDNTAKTRRPQPRSNTKKFRVPYASKSSGMKNKKVEVEEHHRNLLLSKNKRHISSECKNIKLAIQIASSEVVCVMCKQCLITTNHDVCVLNYVNDMNSRDNKQSANVSNIEHQKKQKPKVKKPKKVGSKERLALPTPSEPSICHRWSPTRRIFDCNGKIIKFRVSKCQSDNSNGDNACTSNPQEPISKRNDHIAAILGYGDLQWGNILITRVYFIEGLGHNLFSVGHFCHSDLEVAFRRNTCYVRNLEGVDLLKGNRTTNLYTINLYDMASVSPICLIAGATSTKSWLWHQRLSYLNFDTINDLAKNDLATGLPKFRYHKEHLCPSCEK
ncbi:retrovirus-related pol polyprotein from transposon TNT 1-94 [Tanacetum coccineum]